MGLLAGAFVTIIIMVMVFDYICPVPTPWPVKRRKAKTVNLVKVRSYCLMSLLAAKKEHQRAIALHGDKAGGYWLGEQEALRCVLVMLEVEAGSKDAINEVARLISTGGFTVE